MFQTFANAELTKPPLPEIAGGESKFWGYVIHPLELPWFHVTLGFGADRRVLLSAHVSDWTAIPTMPVGDTMRLIDVRLVTPAKTNGSSDWKMERLLEVWQGNEPASEHPAWIFVVEGGRRYVQAERHTHEPLITNLIEIYRAGRQEKAASAVDV